MRVLLDECTPRQLRPALPGHDVRTVARMGWAGKRDGELLRLMLAAGIEVLLTIDTNLKFQHNLATAGGAVIVLSVGSNRVPDLLPLMPSVLTALMTIQPGDVVEITN